MCSSLDQCCAYLQAGRVHVNGEGTYCALSRQCACAKTLNGSWPSNLKTSVAAASELHGNSILLGWNMSDSGRSNGGAHSWTNNLPGTQKKWTQKKEDMSGCSTEKPVFVDETGSDAHNYIRRFGYSLHGLRAARVTVFWVEDRGYLQLQPWIVQGLLN